MFQFIPILLVKEDEIVRSCDRHSIETVTLTKHISKYKNCENGWSNFSENLRIMQLKVVEITRFLSQKSVDLQLFTFILHGVGVRCDVGIFKLTASAQSIYIEKSISHLKA